MVVVPIWAVCVAYSRPLLGVHTAVDVIAATLIGFCLGTLAAAAIHRAVGHFAPAR